MNMMAVDILGVKTFIIYRWCIMTGENPSFIDSVKNPLIWVFGGNNVFLMWLNFTDRYMIIKNLSLSIINKYIQLIECSNSAGQGILIASAIVCIRKTVYFHEGSLLQGQFVCDTKKHSTFRIQFIL